MFLSHFTPAERCKLTAIKAISKKCFYCDEPIRLWQQDVGLCGPFDYIRAHKKCAKKRTGIFARWFLGIGA